MTIAARWTAGPHHGVVWPGGAMAVAGSVPLTAVVALLESFVARPPAGLADACDRVDAQAPGAPAGLVVRGAAGAEAAHRADGGWARVEIGHALAVRLTPREVSAVVGDLTEGDDRPLGAGVVPAAALVWRVPSSAEPTVRLPLPAGPASALSSQEPPAGLITGVPRSVLPASNPPAPAYDVAPPPAPPPAAPPAAPPPAAPPPPAPAEPADHDGLTVAKAGRPGPHVAVSPAPGDPRSVLALVCPQGHPNPTSRSVCRACTLTLTGPARRVSRPSLGTVRSSAGDLIELTAPVVVGRNPRAPRGSVETPLLLALPQPHVSGSHLELRPDGWVVLAVDLESTNGTFLRRRGEPTLRLSGTPTPLMDGDVVDLGHGVSLTVEGLP